MKNMLEMKNISFKYYSKNIFNNFNFNIKKGDFVYLVGTNNSGKSTLINILKGFPFDGEIYINNIQLILKNRNKINEFISIIDNETIKNCKINNVIDELRNLSSNNFEKVSKDYQNLEISSELFCQLSYVDKIKSIIIIELLRKSEFIIIDRLIDILNDKDKQIIYKIIKKYNRLSGKTILIISNNTDGIIYAKRILVLNKGNIDFDGTIKDIDKNDNIFDELSIKLPFIIDLSIKLKLYDLIDKIYIDEKRMIKDLWKI